MKQSPMVGLVLLGTAVGVAGHFNGSQSLQQQQYVSKSDCDNDWGDGTHCTASPDHPGIYLGPRYYWDSAVGRPMAVASDGTVSEVPNARITSSGSLSGSTHSAGSISRGGFGSTGGAMGRGGS
jgi:hypothetical protein